MYNFLEPAENRLLLCHPGNCFPVSLQIQPKNVIKDTSQEVTTKTRNQKQTRPTCINSLKTNELPGQWDPHQKTRFPEIRHRPGSMHRHQVLIQTVIAFVKILFNCQLNFYPKGGRLQGQLNLSHYSTNPRNPDQTDNARFVSILL